MEVKATVLTNLNVARNDISGAAAQQLATAALGSKSLEVLSEVPIKELRADTLTELDLSGKGLGATEGIVLAELIKVTTAMTKLNLAMNQFGDKGGVAIANALGVNATLTSLDLSSNLLDDQTKAKLTSAAKSTLKLEL